MNELETNDKKYPINASRDKRDIYTFIASEACDSFFDKLVWYIPVRKCRHDIRTNLRKYAIDLSAKYLGLRKYNDDTMIINIKIIDNYLKHLIDKKIRYYIESNHNEINKIIEYINKYKK